MEHSGGWALLAGAKGTNKTSRLLEVVARLRDAGLVVGGIVQDVIPAADGSGERDGYVARALLDDACEILAARAKGGVDEASKQLVCSFAFDVAALGRVRSWVERDARAADVVVIDEVSKLEAARGGHHDAVVAALAGRALPLLCVRADQLFHVMERFGLEEPVAALESAKPEALRDFADRIVEAVRRRSP